MNAALGSGCDTIDNAVTSNTRGPEFESSPWGFTSNKTKTKQKKSPGMAHLQRSPTLKYAFN